MSGPEAQVDLLTALPRVPGGRVRLVGTLGRLGRLAARRAGRSVVLTFALLDDRAMADLHRRHVGPDEPTDVLAFSLCEEPRLEGDVAVGVEVARREAAVRGHPAYDEVVLYAVHGVLHLLGHDDHDPSARRRMRHAERTWLAWLGIPPVYGRGRVPA